MNDKKVLPPAVVKHAPKLLLHGFAPGSWLCLLLLILSAWLATLSYESRQISNQVELRSKLTRADPIAHFCQSLPQFSRALCDAKLEIAPDTSQLNFELLLSAEVISRDDFETAADLDDNAPREVRFVSNKLNEVLVRRFSDQSVDSTSGMTSLSELAGLRCLNDAAGDADNGQTNAVAEVDIFRGKVAAHLLADIPSGEDDAWTLERNCDSALLNARELMSTAKTVTLPKPDGRRLTSRTCIGAADVLLLLSEQSSAVALPPSSEKSTIDDVGYQIDSTGSRCISKFVVDDGNKAFTEQEFLKAQDNITRLSEFLLALTFETSEVKSALTTLRMWRGPEHIGIIALSIFVLLVASARISGLGGIYLRQDVSRYQGAEDKHEWLRANELGARLQLGGTETWLAQRELDEGRRYQRWALASIPAIGFIGTVRGILNALPEAREVVFASSTLGRADAIGTLAGELGLSFSTTLFALIASLLLSFVLLVASRIEATMLRLLGSGKDQMPPNSGTEA